MKNHFILKMKNYLPLLCLLFSCSKTELKNTTKKETLSEHLYSQVPDTTVCRPDHVVFVWFENKGYSQIVGSSNAPYINLLKTKGTLFSNAHGRGHPSYPNYIKFFSALGQGVTNDNCINTTTNTSPNLYTALNAKAVTFRWYSEGLPSSGYTGCSNGYYREKHNPTTIFSNVPQTTVNLPLTSLNLTDTAQFKNWPDVVCVTPNMQNDMHDGTIEQGDAWLKSKFDKYISWAMIHNSMLVVYWDEDNGTAANTIPVIIVGQHVIANKTISTLYDHYNFTRTVLDWWDAAMWNENLTSRSSITGFYK